MQLSQTTKWFKNQMNLFEMIIDGKFGTGIFILDLSSAVHNVQGHEGVHPVIYKWPYEATREKHNQYGIDVTSQVVLLLILIFEF